MGTKSEEELMNIMEDMVNVGLDSDKLTNELRTKHRKLQLYIFRQIVKPIIIEFARMEEEGDYDARNQMAVESCREIVEKMDWYVPDKD